VETLKWSRLIKDIVLHLLFMNIFHGIVSMLAFGFGFKPIAPGLTTAWKTKILRRK
jgi:hypothetical protein